MLVAAPWPYHEPLFTAFSIGVFYPCLDDARGTHNSSGSVPCASLLNTLEVYICMNRYVCCPQNVSMLFSILHPSCQSFMKIQQHDEAVEDRIVPSIARVEYIV